MYGAPEGIRTPDRSVRSRVLYPAELQAHILRDALSRFMLGTSIYIQHYPRDYSGYPALTPSGPSADCADVKNRSQRFLIPDSCPTPLRAALRAFKFIPDEFVEQGFLSSPLALQYS